ncbi:hypothetical protein K523DRAFT_160887 [Schizophyllum commune Tattone D]|nr:hypothetical protein K523DRAFT_160887 [Schizophyllum commune Tattone D]
MDAGVSSRLSLSRQRRLVTAIRRCRRFHDHNESGDAFAASMLFGLSVSTLAPSILRLVQSASAPDRLPLLCRTPIPPQSL